MRLATRPQRARRAAPRAGPTPRPSRPCRFARSAAALTPRSVPAPSRAAAAVLRMPVAGSMALLDLATEARAMRRGRGRDLAPAVIAVDVEAGLLLTDYRADALDAGRSCAGPPAVTTIVRLLRALHRARRRVAGVRVARIAADYLAALRASRHAAPSAAEQRWADELTRLGRHFDETLSAPTAFCHNDLVALPTCSSTGPPPGSSTSSMLVRGCAAARSRELGGHERLRRKRSDGSCSTSIRRAGARGTDAARAG